MRPGTFANLPEGALVKTSSGHTFAITYAAGDSSDVALIVPSAHLSEGATGPFFDTDIQIANPNDEPVPLRIEFLRDDGVVIVQTPTLPARSHTTVHVDSLAGLEATAVSTVVHALNGLPLAVERTMRWDQSGYGMHIEKASSGAAAEWFFAEGSQGFFSTYFLLANPQTIANTAHVTYFREGEPPLTRSISCRPPRASPSMRAPIRSSSIARSARRSSSTCRAWPSARWFRHPSPLFSGGHDAAGVTAPSTTWFLAEGATGSYWSRRSCCWPTPRWIPRRSR